MKIKEKVFDITTQEETIIEREETKDETKLRLDYAAFLIKEEEEMKIKSKAKAAVLERLGITEEEAKLLLG